MNLWKGFAIWKAKTESENGKLRGRVDLLEMDIKNELKSFKQINERAISIRFTVNFKNKSKGHNCTLVARDIETNVVGEKLFEFPVGVTSQDVTTSIPTRATAVNAGILGCEIR